MTSSSSSPPVALTIAGSDSAGGAGLAADLRTFAAHRVHGACAITVVTAQDTERVRAAHPLPVELVVEQISAVVDDLDVVAVKTGLLLTAELVEAVAELVAAERLPAPVVDPVLVDRSGRPLGPPDRHRALVEAYRDRLLPVAIVSTPNRDEAVLLGGLEISDVDSAELAAVRLAERSGAPVLVTGGRLEAVDAAGRPALVDVLATDDGAAQRFWSERVTTRNDHGTGDTLSAAIAAELARGSDLTAAIGAAVGFTAAATARASAWSLGAGHGPIDQLG